MQQNISHKLVWIIPTIKPQNYDVWLDHQAFTPKITLQNNKHTNSLKYNGQMLTTVEKQYKKEKVTEFNLHVGVIQNVDSTHLLIIV